MPIGIDPGGVMIAIASDSGIDYTRPEIANRLARDGEGELIGWDFVDDDRKPYASLNSGPLITELARLILSETPTARLAIFRAKLGDTIALGRLAVYAARSQSRIVLVTSASANRADWEAFAEVVAHFKRMLVVAPVEQGIAPFPAALGLNNLLTVAALESLRAEPRGDHPLPDLAITTSGKGATAAAAQIVAVAAQLVARKPALEGAALKARIVANAVPLPAPLMGATRYGLLMESAIPAR